MCIILCCDPGKRPSETLIDTCWASNPDGAGFMYPENGEVHGRKGFMDLPSLKDALKDVPEDVSLCIHFRIGTSGGDDERVTHPYPVSGFLGELHATDWVSPYGIAHNGVIHGLFTDDEGGISDTVSYILSVAEPALDFCESKGLDYMDDHVRELLANTSRCSRLMVMDGDGEVMLTGIGWNTCAEGILASNTSWMSYHRRGGRYWTAA